MDWVLEETDEVIEVADITFAMNNEGMLNLLTKRGSYTTQGKFRELPYIDVEIKNYKEKHHQELIRPVGVFITF